MVPYRIESGTYPDNPSPLGTELVRCMLDLLTRPGGLIDEATLLLDLLAMQGGVIDEATFLLDLLARPGGLIDEATFILDLLAMPDRAPCGAIQQPTRNSLPATRWSGPVAMLRPLLISAGGGTPGLPST